MSHMSSDNILIAAEKQIAAGVIIAWTITIYRQFELLAGKSAPHEFINLLIYKAMTFSDEIQKIDTIRAYHVRFCFIFCCTSPHNSMLNNNLISFSYRAALSTSLKSML